MSLEVIKEKAIRLIKEGYEQGNMDVLRELFHPEYRLHTSANEYTQLESEDLSPGIESSITRTQNIMRKWENRRFDIFSIVSDENLVTVFYKLTFTHNSEFMGIPTTGKRISLNGFHHLTFKDGKIIELAFLQDTYKILRDLGSTVLAQNEQEKVDTYLDNLRRLRIIPYES